MKRVPAAILALMLALSTAAEAAQWALADLGRLDRTDHCLRAAAQTFRELLSEARIAHIRTSEWVVYADAINDRHDAVITCTFGDNRGVRATLVIHSSDKPIAAQMLRRRIGQIFDTSATQIRKQWVDSFK